MKKQYKKFRDARKFAISLNFQSWKQWQEYCKSGNKPNDIPSNPVKIYKNEGWVGVGNWLGTGKIADQLRKYREFSEARKFAHNLKLINGNYWNKFCKSGNKPNDIPSNPWNTYKNKGWKGLADWLGTSPRLRNIAFSYTDSKKWAKKYKIQSRDEWIKFS